MNKHKTKYVADKYIREKYPYNLWGITKNFKLNKKRTKTRAIDQYAGDKTPIPQTITPAKAIQI